MLRTRKTAQAGLVVCAVGLLSLLVGAGCPSDSLPIDDGSGDTYNNTADPTNNNAKYVGADACGACHPAIAAQHIVHGHAHKLTPVAGGAPTFPAEGIFAAVPNTPDGFAWDDVSYVIGGYTRKARFVDQEGYILTTGFNKVNTQWNLTFPPNGTTPKSVAYEGSNTSRKPYDYSCFICHTTGPAAQDPANPQFQDNRPGLAGTWEETGIQCEACHGPGSNHIPNPEARDLFVDTSAKSCGQCHTRPHPSLGNADGMTIPAKSDGYIDHHEQWPELLASGGHANLDCVDCHDPHVSAYYDRANAMRAKCEDCHADKTMGYHEGKQYVKGDYVEELTCVSCHMPYVGKSATSALVGDSKGRVGDIKTHIFRINVDAVDFNSMFTADKKAVAKDADGKAAVTLDFVCLRCHNTENGTPFKLTLESAAQIATGVHPYNP